VDLIQNVGVAGGNNKPHKAVTIVKSGELEVPEEGIHVEL
jgi:hypothetical protein